MKKKIKIIAIGLAAAVTLAVIASATKMLQSYTSPSDANYPTLKNGDRFFTSILIKPESLVLLLTALTLLNMGYISVYIVYAE